MIESILRVNSLTLFGFILILGVIGGHLANTSRFFPKITGYILIGLLVGPNMLGLITESSLIDAKVFIDIAVGLVLYQLGLQVNLRKLYHNRNIVWMGIAESIFTFVMVFVVLYCLKIDMLTAALAAAIGVSSSPALTLFVANQRDSIGLVTERSLSLTAINNLIAFFIFMSLLPFLHSAANPASFTFYMLADPLYHLVGSILLGSALGYLMIKIGRLIGQREDAQFALLVGVLIFSIGLANMLKVSPVLTPLILGIITINTDKEDHLMDIELGHGGNIFFIILFVITGAKLHLNHLLAIGTVAFAFVTIRMFSKCLPVYILSRLHGLNNTKSYALGLTLLPMAGMAIGLLNTATAISTNVADLLSSIILASIAIIELTAPVITLFAFKKAGEIPLDAAVMH